MIQPVRRELSAKAGEQMTGGDVLGGDMCFTRQKANRLGATITVTNAISMCIFVMAIGIPASAAAQTDATSERGDVRSEARGHLGPFYLTPGVRLKELGVDSNVFNSAGEQKSDFTFTVTPIVNVSVPMARRALFTTTLASDLVWYAHYETERSVNPQVTARGEVYLNRITVFGETAQLSTRQRPNYEIDVRSRRADDTVSTGVRVALTSKFSVEVAAHRDEIRYDSDAEFDATNLERTLNRDTRGVQLTARHRLTPLTTLAVRAQVDEDRFIVSPSRNSDSYRVLPGVEFAPQALLRGSAYLGYRKFTPVGQGVLQPFSGLVGELGLSYTLLGATAFGVSFRRDLTYSYSEFQPFFVDTALGASIRRALGRRFDVLGSADRHVYGYRGFLTAGLDDLQRVDITWNYAASVGYHLGRSGRVGFGASYIQRDSTILWRAYDNLRFGTTFSYGL
jgi:putative beta-barrel porin BBP2